jgi:D-glycero-D-manno-heptose 1,7-bisphosphate phosphatase
MKKKAVFLDRDGVVNELVYYHEHGVIDSPFTADQLRIIPGVAEAIKKFKGLGYKVILVSNQPGIAKNNLSESDFASITEKMRRDLKKEGAVLDAEYYCFHHPEAKVESLRVNCACRKPKPGLLFQAARELRVNLGKSWMIGDSLSDIKAGKDAGCRAVLIGRMKCELCELMDKEGVRPNIIVPNLLKAASLIAFQESDLVDTLAVDNGVKIA